MLHLKIEQETPPKTSTDNPFPLLPDELVFQIFKEIDQRQNSYRDVDIIPQSQRDLKNLCQVDKRLSRIASDVLWSAPLLKSFNVEDFKEISKKPIQHLDLNNFEYSTQSPGTPESNEVQKLFRMLSSVESLTSLSSSTVLLLIEDCLSKLTNLRTLVVTGLLTGWTIAKVLSPSILKSKNLHTLVLDKVDVLNDMFKLYELEVPEEEKDEEAGLLKMFSAISELKNLKDLRITLSPYVGSQSHRRLDTCCNFFRESRPNVKVEIVDFKDLIWHAFVASGKLAASEKRAREEVSDVSDPSDDDNDNDNDGDPSGEEDHYNNDCVSDDDF